MSKQHQDSATLSARDARAGDALPPEFLKKKKKEEDSKKDSKGKTKDAVVTASKQKMYSAKGGKK